KRPLPAFVLEDAEFLEQFRKAHSVARKGQRGQRKTGVSASTENHQTTLFADPTDGVPPEADLAWHVRAWGRWVLQRARADLERFYPTVDGKPTVAYLWARTVRCKNCRATIPLLKTRWLCKKENKRVVLTMAPNAERTGVVFGVQTEA